MAEAFSLFKDILSILVVLVFFGILFSGIFFLVFAPIKKSAPVKGAKDNEDTLLPLEPDVVDFGDFFDKERKEEDLKAIPSTFIAIDTSLAEGRRMGLE